MAPLTVPQTVVCDRRGETQAGDLGRTLQLGVDLQREQSTACAVTVSALPFCADGDVPKAVPLVGWILKQATKVHDRDLFMHVLVC